MSKPTFKYTDCHSFGWSSDLVSTIYFNEKTQELLVRLHGGRMYLYMNVPSQKFNDFKNAVSAGSFYNAFIKNSKNVKSVGFIGYSNDVELSFVEVNTSEFEVTVRVTLTTTVRVSAENFDSAATLAMDEVEKIKGAEADDMYVTGVKKL